MAQVNYDGIPSETTTDVRHELEEFVKSLIGTGKDSLTVEIPETRELQRAVDTLGYAASTVARIIDQPSQSIEVREHALKCLWSAMASAFVIGKDGTLSDNSKVVAPRVQAQAMREKASRSRQEDPTTQIMREEVRKRLRLGMKLHPRKAMLSYVNQALAAGGLPTVSRGRLDRIIKKDFPARS